LHPFYSNNADGLFSFSHEIDSDIKQVKGYGGFSTKGEVSVGISGELETTKYFAAKLSSTGVIVLDMEVYLEDEKILSNWSISTKGLELGLNVKLKAEKIFTVDSNWTYKILKRGSYPKGDNPPEVLLDFNEK
jgi:hypothetical protein